jgi:LytS/YehU family sensor histidine kinase
MAADNDTLLIALSGISSTAAVVYYLRNNRSQKRIQELEKELHKLDLEIRHLETENASARLNPHLLKNTLNAIYSYSWQTTNAIEKLSEMLKYILNESKRQYVPLSEEVEFLKAYYEVHKLKLSPLTKDNFTLNVNPEAGNFKIAPLLTINFIENAFIHGDYTRSDSVLDLNISVTQNELIYQVKNTFTKGERSTGIGNENFRKRLELLHPGRYEVHIEPSEKIYTATLKILLNEN